MKRLVLLFFLLPLLLHAQEKIEDQWYSLLLESNAVGYVHQTTWRTADGLVRSEIEQTMKILRFGVPFTLTQKDVWIEQAGSGLISLNSQLDMNGETQGVEALTVEGGLQVKLLRGTEEEQFFLPLDDAPFGVYDAEQRIRRLITAQRAHKAQRADNAEDASGDYSAHNGELGYHLFSPESLKVEEIQLSILGQGEMDDSLGRRYEGVLVEERSSALPGVVTTEVYSEEGRLLYSRIPVGLALEILRLDSNPEVSPKTDRGVDIAAVFDVASLTIPVRRLRALPEPLEKVQTVTIAFRGGGVATLREALQAAEKDLGGGQSAQTHIVSSPGDTRRGDEELVVHLEKRGYQAEVLSSDSSLQPPEVDTYVRGGFHLDLEDPRLAELLAGCRTGSTGGPAQVICLERLVYEYIENKSLAYGFAGLKEILERKAGDCTEHALLMVALLRKIDVPSRMAYGLILTEGGFIGHAWVELFADGKWHWLDPSFPEGRPYGLKIRLGVMDPGEPVWTTLGLSLFQVVGGVEAEILDWDR
jgi:hypothetical protein